VDHNTVFEQVSADAMDGTRLLRSKKPLQNDWAVALKH
jgi:hypothetical protein